MKRGAVVYATDQGLGIQAKSFFDHGIFTEVLVWPHSSYENHHEWYPNRVASFDELLDKCDEVIFFETPFDWKFIIKAREKGKKTIFFVMYECTRYPFVYIPDVLVGGSVMETELCGAVHINVPVEVPFRLRKKAEVFVHNAGHGGIGGRNGTRELLEAIKYVKSPAKFIIRSQNLDFKSDDPRVTIYKGSIPYEDLFREGDVFVYPDKFGGSCLPLQEAHASGMLVMASNRHPSNTWLPIDPLIPIRGYKKERIITEFNSAIVDPRDIAKTIDEWYGKDITQYSLDGRDWAKKNSWKALKPKYEAL